MEGAYLELKDLLTPGFQQVWGSYPARARAKQKICAQYWWRYRLEPRAAEIVGKIERLRKTQWQGREPSKIPMLLTYLNDQMYDDPLVDLDAMEGKNPRGLTDKEYRTVQNAMAAEQEILHGSPGQHAFLEGPRRDGPDVQ